MATGVHKQAQPLKEVLANIVSGFGWEELVNQDRIPELWKEIVGEKISGKAGYIRFENGVLFIRVESSVWRSELFLRKNNFRDEINKRMGSKIVDEIVIR
jgi:predicted nucleic acid-binding Zn ribbon protein